MLPPVGLPAPGRPPEADAVPPLFRQVFDTCPDAVLVTEAEPLDEPGPRILYVNPAFTRDTGYPAAEAVGRSPRFLQGPATDRAELDRLRAALRAWRPARAELLNYRKDGTPFWVELSVTPVADDSGRYTHWVGVQRDVTARKRAERAAAETAAQFAALADAMPDGVFVLDPVGPPDELVIRYANAAAGAIHGYAPDELVGRSIVRLLDDAPTAAEAPDRVARVLAGEVLTFEAAHRHRDGRPIPIEVRAAAIAWHGKPAVLGLCRDVSDHKRAEQALREGEGRLRLAVEGGRLGTFDWDIAGDRIVWNRRHFEVFGYPPDRADPPAYRHFADRLHPDDRERVETQLAAAVAAASDYSDEFRVRWPDGTVRWVQSVARFLRGPDGRPVRLLGVIQDVTDRVTAERAVHDRERFLDAVVENSPVGIQLFAPDGTPRRANPAVAALPIAALDAAVREAVAAAAAGHVVGLTERPAGATPDGRPQAWYDCLFYPVYGPDGAVVAVVRFVQDVTERVKARADRERLEAEVRQAQKLEAVGRLAGGIAHDFNNVLTAVTVFAELMVEQDGPGRDLAASVLQAAGRGAELTRKLLAFGRKQVSRPEVLDLNAVLGGFGRLLPRLLGEQVAVAVRPAADLWPVRADRGQVEQVLMNLAINARDAMPAGGRLELATANLTLTPSAVAGVPGAAPGEYAWLTVADTGHGMSADVQARLFEPFFTTKEVGKGTGLGLATVYAAVREAGGFVTVESAVGRGTRVHVHLPRCPHPAAPPAAGPRSGAVRPQAGTILLVDDDDLVRRSTAALLARDGYRVIPVADGEAALAACAALPAPPDLVLTDVVMPGMGGRELAERLAARHPGLRVAFASGYTGDEVLRHGIRDSQVAFLQKPFTADDLRAFVGRVLGRP